MCGICGAVTMTGSKELKNGLLKMNSAMVHRGPDDEGMYFNYDDPRYKEQDITAALAHRRLSIIDLKTGHQPMHNEDKTIWLVANGEIYNFRELKDSLIKKGHMFHSQSDNEVIIHSYETYGEEFVNYLRGMFAFAIWDERKKKLVLARDRLGKKPLLYTHFNGQFVFASEFKALLAYPGINRIVNHKALAYYLRLFYVPAPLTAFENIYKLPPAHLLIYKDGEARVRKYWELDFSNPLDIDENKACEEIFERMLESVKLRLISDVPLGAFLSGGLDSSVVVALMSRLSKGKVKTFSIGFDEGDYNELSFAREVARYYDTEHYEFIVKPDAIAILPELIEAYGEPFADSSAVPTYYVSKITRQYVKVALSGDGGDENFAGYERFFANRWANRYQTLPKFARLSFESIANWSSSRYSSTKSNFGRIQRFIKAASLPCPERYEYWLSSIDKQLQHSLYSYEFLQKIKDVDTTKLMLNAFESSKTKDIVNSSLFTEIQLTLPNDYLVKVDIASMINSLEVRCPFLDHELMEFTAKLPSYLKLKFMTSKYILKKMIMRYRLLPQKLLKRRKMGFAIPIDNWFRKEAREILCDTLLSQKSQKRDYFQPKMVELLVQEHISGKRNYGPQLWTLLMFELWHQRFID